MPGADVVGRRRRSPSWCSTSSASCRTPDDLRAGSTSSAGAASASVRTGALNARQADALEPLGFVPIQHLALLEHRAPQDVPAPDRHHRPAAGRRARGRAAPSTTPRSARRGASTRRRSPRCATPPTATGRGRCTTAAGSSPSPSPGATAGSGFLQRLAVDPRAQRAGPRPPAGARQPALGGALARRPGAGEHPRRQRGRRWRCTTPPASCACPTQLVVLERQLRSAA